MDDLTVPSIFDRRPTGPAVFQIIFTPDFSKTIEFFN
jgi:hypothetical protein